MFKTRSLYLIGLALLHVAVIPASQAETTAAPVGEQNPNQHIQAQAQPSQKKTVFGSLFGGRKKAPEDRAQNHVAASSIAGNKRQRLVLKPKTQETEKSSTWNFPWPRKKSDAAPKPTPAPKLAAQHLQPAPAQRKVFQQPTAPKAMPPVAVKEKERKPAKIAERKPSHGFFGIRRKKKSKPEAGIKHEITKRSTPFYSMGPTQPFPPDDFLAVGVVVDVVENFGGWCDIVLPNGETGTVSSDFLKVWVPPAPKIQEVIATTESTFSAPPVPLVPIAPPDLPTPERSTASSLEGNLLFPTLPLPSATQ